MFHIDNFIGVIKISCPPIGLKFIKVNLKNIDLSGFRDKDDLKYAP